MFKPKSVIHFFFKPSIMKGAILVGLLAFAGTFTEIYPVREMLPSFIPLIEPISKIENAWTDYRMKFRGRMQPGGDVIIVGVDEKSITNLGRWPWPRQRVAKLVRKLKDYGVKVIAFDMVFSEQEVNSNKENLEELNSLVELQSASHPKNSLLTPLKERIKRMKDSADGDLALNESLRYFMSDKTPDEASQFAVLGYLYITSDKRGKEVLYSPEDLLPKDPTPAQLPLVGSELAFLPGAKSYLFLDPKFEVKLNKLIVNLPKIALLKETKTDGEVERVYFPEGFFSDVPDFDGIFRQFQLFRLIRGTLYPSLALQAVSYFRGEMPLVSVNDFGKVSAQFGEGEWIPVNRDGTMRINYHGPGRTFPHYSAADILSDEKEIRREVSYNQFSDEAKLKTEALGGKIAFIGVTALGQFDIRHTPLDSFYPGVEAHANVAESILNKRYLTLPEKYQLAVPLLAGVIPILFGFLLRFLGPVMSFLSVLLLLAGIAAGDQTFLFNQGILVPSSMTFIGLILTYIWVTTYKYFTESAEKRRVKATFSRYVSPAVLTDVLSDPEKVKLGSVKRELSIMFSDIRGFTNLSEKMDAKELSDFLNLYLSSMTNIILDEGGTIDKYMGDCVMAFWGAPVEMEDHAERAVCAALQMRLKLREINAEMQAKGFPGFDIGVGINSGKVSVGNMGSERIFDYTVIGDHVNLASRVEGINKEYGTVLMVTENTWDQVSEHFIGREIDRVTVKGKENAVKLFELIGKKGETLSQSKQEALECFSKGYALYQAEKFEEARQFFQRAVDVDGDPPSKTFISRCEIFIQNPPPSPWNGVWAFKTK